MKHNLVKEVAGRLAAPYRMTGEIIVTELANYIDERIKEVYEAMAAAHGELEAEIANVADRLPKKKVSAPKDEQS